MEKSDSVDKILKSYGISPSFQRMKIYEYLLKNMNHPTIDTIYKELVTQIPTLPKTTVYNTLKLFISKKIVSPLTIEDNEVRYDCNTSYHAHFKCTRCGTIKDISIDNEMISSLDGLDGNNISTVNINITGVCCDCRE